MPWKRGLRSLSIVCFRLPDQSLEGRFLAEARERGLYNLKGHPAVGGLRASLYNAMPQQGVDALVDFMQAFAAGHASTAWGAQGHLDP